MLIIGFNDCYDGIVEGLKEGGFKKGLKLDIDYRVTDGDAAKSVEAAKSLAGGNYNLVIGISTPSSLALQNAMGDKKTPLVFSAVSDAQKAGIDTTKGNVTGTSDYFPMDEQLKMIRSFLPEAKTIGILYDTSEANSISQLEQLNSLAPGYGFTIKVIGINSMKDIDIAVDSIAGQVDCIDNLNDNLVAGNIKELLKKADGKGIPVFGSDSGQVKLGCLAAQSLDYHNLGLETGRMAARVLKGEKAGSIPVEVMRDYKTYVNKDAMSRLKITLPGEYRGAEQY
jgi:putative ABC transport system substrate-binding protein